MKVILAISLMATLALGAVAPALQSVYALQADGISQLHPKSFGEKTKNKINTLNIIQKNGFDSKKTDMTHLKKITAEYKAKQLLKQLYRM